MDMVAWIAVGSVSTAIVVLINLYLIFFQPRWNRPKFFISLEMSRPFCREVASPVFAPREPSTPTLARTYWVRVKVKNSGKSVAYRCLGKLIEVMGDEGKVLYDFDPMQLHWVGTDWGAVPFINISLNREDYEYLDVLVTQQGDSKIYICGDQFVWSKYKPRGIQNSLQTGSYILRVSVYGDNVDPETKFLSLIWGEQDFKDISVEIHDSFEKAKAWLDERRSD
jgi:hypothetical protein